MTTNRIFLALSIAVLLSATTWFFLRHNDGKTSREDIRVGILHSLSGTMAISERSVAAATRMAIDEINAGGGLLGRRVVAIERDGASDWSIFARAAEDLIDTEQVAAVFGCWTSASRKTVKPIFEARDHLLFYPVQYEGLEQSPNIVYTGAAPNQQIVPAVKWAMDKLGKRFFLIGSDYVFPHAAHAIIKDQIRSLKGRVVGGHYVLLGSTAVDEAVEAIARSRPDVILNTLNGDSNIAFFKALRARGIRPEDIPTISFSIAEAELKAMNRRDFAGDYAAWNYFQSLPGDANRDFVSRYQARHGTEEVVTDPMEAAYLGVHLWAAAVRKSGSSEPRTVRRALQGLSFDAPEGAVSVDPASQHLWKSVRIGKIRSDGQFDIVWSTPKPARPLPFPPYRTPAEWQAFLDRLYAVWQGHWANPGATPSQAGEAP